MFEYHICNQADERLFYAQCNAVEKHIRALEKKELLVDVDGTRVQQYEHRNGHIMVKNDLQVNALYVISEFDLLPYFS